MTHATIISTKQALLLLITITLFSCKARIDTIRPYGAVPTKSQLEWQKMEYYMFVHFGPNTFTDVEWGNGQENPKVFNPASLDCKQWVAVAKAAGMKGIIITAKHHDGFCLWPSKYSTHTVRESGWKNGQGDVLRELSEACKEAGLKFGVYLSPWDRNNPSYGTPAYNQLFANTLNEVLSSYGSVFEQWFDGANGDGVKHQTYDWDLFHQVVYKNQPQAIIFSDIGPGCRWMGNEQGIAGETNWSRLNIEGFEPGKKAPSVDTLNRGNRNGTHWVPAETDVSIRPGWFYSPSTNDKVKTLTQLAEIYDNTIGRNSNLLLNVPADRSGRIHSTDSLRLMEFRKYLDDTYRTNLAEGATVTADRQRTASNKYSPSAVLDKDYDTYWTTDENIHTGTLTIRLNGLKTFNRLLIQEYIALGQRIESFKVDYWNLSEKRWMELTEGTTVGYKRILHFNKITTDQLRIHILKSLACPLINNIGLYKAPDIISIPDIKRNKQGDVSISSENTDYNLYYTTDGTDPDTHSLLYTQPFNLKQGGVVKAIAVDKQNMKSSEIAGNEFDIASADWVIESPQIEDAGKLIDGDPYHSATVEKNLPIVICLGTAHELKGFYYIPVNDMNATNIARFKCRVSTDGQNWNSIITNGQFNNIKNNPVRQSVLFAQPVKAKYIRLEPTELTSDNQKYGICEIGIITR